MTYSVKNMFKILRALVQEGYISKTKLGIYLDMMIMDMMAQEGSTRNFECLRADLYAAAEKGELD